MLMRPGALPLYQQILLDVFAPPFVLGIWWLLSRNLQSALGTTNDPVVQGWTAPMAKFLLVAMYVICFGITAYAYFF